jgi:hypothetical protein
MSATPKTWQIVAGLPGVMVAFALLGVLLGISAGTAAVVYRLVLNLAGMS